MSMIVYHTPLIESTDGTVVDLPRMALAETEYVHKNFTLPASATTDVFPSELTTIDFLVMTSSTAVTYTANGADTAQTLDANGQVILAGTAITSLTITEAAAATPTVELWMWGA